MALQPAAGYSPLEHRPAPNDYNANGGTYLADPRSFDGPDTQQRHTDGLGIDTTFPRDGVLNGGTRDMGYDGNTGTSSPTDGRIARNKENGRGDTPRDRSRTNGGVGAKSSGTMRTCGKCGEPLTGQFVRALGGTFHLDCFKCRVCRTILALNKYILLTKHNLGLRTHRRLQILPRRRRSRYRPISLV